MPILSTFLLYELYKHIIKALSETRFKVGHGASGCSTLCYSIMIFIMELEWLHYTLLQLRVVV